MCSAQVDVRFVPIANIWPGLFWLGLFDHLIGALPHLQRHIEAKAFAVLRLITSWYLVGACTGRLPGFSPLSLQFSQILGRQPYSIVRKILYVIAKPCRGQAAPFEHRDAEPLSGAAQPKPNVRKTLDTTGTFEPYVEAKQESALFVRGRGRAPTLQGVRSRQAGWQVQWPALPKPGYK